MDAEIDTDGRTIWVNGPDGCCLGRFSPFGIDAHRTFAEQAAGLGQCLACTHERPTAGDWQFFRDMMEKHHAVVVPESLRPSWL